MRVAYIAVLVLGLVVLCPLASSCPGPDAEKEVQEAVQVPGLTQAVIAKDRAIKTAIIASWMADVELTQEQLAVEDVHAGKVRITGIVSREVLKERAEKIAQEQEGVSDVVSTITVDESLQENRINLDEI